MESFAVLVYGVEVYSWRHGSAPPGLTLLAHILPDCPALSDPMRVKLQAGTNSLSQPSLMCFPAVAQSMLMKTSNEAASNALTVLLFKGSKEHLHSHRSLRNPDKGEPSMTPMKKMVAVALFIHFWLQTRSHWEDIIQHIPDFFYWHWDIFELFPGNN